MPYCGKECQRTSWSLHKLECRALLHLRAVNAALAFRAARGPGSDSEGTDRDANLSNTDSLPDYSDAGLEPPSPRNRHGDEVPLPGANSPGKYALDLGHKLRFPPFASLPTVYDDIRSGDWYFLCEIVGNESFYRPMYRVLDTMGIRVLIAFYLNNGSQSEERLSAFSTGTTLIIRCPFAKVFLDGQHGIRLEDDDVASVTNLPCSLAKLQSCNAYLRINSKECKSCGQPAARKRCARCLAPYCRAECHEKAWATHKSECNVYAHLCVLNAAIAEART